MEICTLMGYLYMRIGVWTLQCDTHTHTRTKRHTHLETVEPNSGFYPFSLEEIPSSTSTKTNFSNEKKPLEVTRQPNSETFFYDSSSQVAIV